MCTICETNHEDPLGLNQRDFSFKVGEIVMLPNPLRRTNGRLTVHSILAAQASLDEDARPGVTEWRRGLHLDPTMPEFRKLIRDAEDDLMAHPSLSSIEESQRKLRTHGVGYVLLQLLAIQVQLGEPLNLNGDTLKDLADGSICPVPVQDLRPPTFERIRASENDPSQTISVDEPKRNSRKRKNVETASQRGTTRAKISSDMEEPGVEFSKQKTGDRRKRAANQPAGAAAQRRSTRLK
ncbi:hypothetical protein C8J57DRAFT_1251978 [Mycena rebaudengoi]|nr:hypothetical protein C8J57DRAFT_1251978 [Mycena rebaudengoi]